MLCLCEIRLSLLFTVLLRGLAADIEFQGDRSIINQGNFHHGLKYAVLDTVCLVASLYLFDKVLIEAPGFFRVGRAVEVGLRALCRLSQESKLRYAQHLAADVRYILLPPAAGLVVPQLHAQDLVCHGLHLLFGITRGHGRKDEDATANGRDQLFLDGDGTRQNALQYSCGETLE